MDAHVQRRELAHLSRVATLGELSGAMAHELSQPMSAVLINAHAARRLLAQEPVAAVIAGATRPEQIRANAEAGTAWRPTTEDLAELDKICPA